MSYFVNDVTFGKHLRTGTGCQEKQHGIRGLELSIPPSFPDPAPPGKVKGLEIQFNQQPMMQSIMPKL